VEEVGEVNTKQIESEADSFYTINYYPRAIVLSNKLIVSDT
jgi:hypothetical protein